MNKLTMIFVCHLCLPGRCLFGCLSVLWSVFCEWAATVAQLLFALLVYLLKSFAKAIGNSQFNRIPSSSHRLSVYRMCKLPAIVKLRKKYKHTFDEVAQTR